MPTHPAISLREALAQQYLLEKDTDQALAVLEESLTLSKDPADPGILRAKTKMAEIRMMKRQPALARALVDDVLAENPKSADANYVMGQLHLAGGRGDQAVTAFRTVVAENPDAANGYLYLGQSHLVNKEVDLAIDVLNQGAEEKSGLQGDSSSAGTCLHGKKGLPRCRGTAGDDCKDESGRSSGNGGPGRFQVVP